MSKFIPSYTRTNINKVKGKRIGFLKYIRKILSKWFAFKANPPIPRPNYMELFTNGSIW